MCTANVCRSTFAQALAQSLVPADQVRVLGAGTHARDGSAMDPLMVAERARRGLPDPGLRSRRLIRDALAGADLVLTTTVAHRAFILDDHPSLVGSTYTLGQFAAAVARVPGQVRGRELLAQVRRQRGMALVTDDVADPYGLGPGPTAAAARQIEELLHAVVPRLPVPAP